MAWGAAMARALRQAELAAARGEVPVGAVLLGAGGELLAEDGNRVETSRDPTAHAEMLVLRAAASSLGASRLPDCTLVVTLEPCPLCAAAAGLFRVGRIVFGAYDPKGGGIEHGPRLYEAPGCLHRPDIVGGVRETASAKLLRAFFLNLR